MFSDLKLQTSLLHICPLLRLDILFYIFDTKPNYFFRFRLSLNAAKTSQRDQHRIPTGEDAHSWVVFHGTCVKVTTSRMLPSTKSYECGKCKKVTIVPADPEQHNACPMPAKCSECSQIGAMRLVMEGENNKPVCTFKDSQEM